MSLWPIHITLVHQGETNAEFSRCDALDVIILCLFLIEKLATGEANHLQSVLLVPIVQLNELLIVALGEGSLRGDVDDECALLTLHEVAEHELVQVDVPYQDRPQLSDYVAHTSVLSIFPRRTEAYTCLSIAHLSSSGSSWINK